MNCLIPITQIMHGDRRIAQPSREIIKINVIPNSIPNEIQ